MYVTNSTRAANQSEIFDWTRYKCLILGNGFFSFKLFGCLALLHLDYLKCLFRIASSLDFLKPSILSSLADSLLRSQKNQLVEFDY